MPRCRSAGPSCRSASHEASVGRSADAAAGRAPRVPPARARRCGGRTPTARSRSSTAPLHLDAGGTRHAGRRAGKVGFRRARDDRRTTAFRSSVNGVPVYCRGACWTVADIADAGRGEARRSRATCAWPRDAGVNMLRVGGTMVYESDALLPALRRTRHPGVAGLHVRQHGLPRRRPGLRREHRGRGAVTSSAGCRAHPCVAVFCGNSEVEQQAAMLGVPRESWRNDWFGTRLPGLCAEYRPGHRVRALDAERRGVALPRPRGRRALLRRRRLPARPVGTAPGRRQVRPRMPGVRQRPRAGRP